MWVTHPVSDLLKLDSEVSVLNDELRLGLLKIWALLVDNKGQQLVLQATLSDSEVDEGGLSLDLRGVVGVAELGVEDQFEVLVVLHILVSKLDIQATSLYQSGLLFDPDFTWIASDSSHKVSLLTLCLCQMGSMSSPGLFRNRTKSKQLSLHKTNTVGKDTFLKVERVMTGLSTASMFSPMFSTRTEWPASMARSMTVTVLATPMRTTCRLWALSLSLIHTIPCTTHFCI